MGNFGKGILTAGLLNQLRVAPKAQNGKEAQGHIPQNSDFASVKLPSLDAPSEQEKPPLHTPLNEKKKIGFAVIGLGHLALEQIMPAFGESEYAKVVALVSGDISKAKKVADQYNVPESCH